MQQFNSSICLIIKDENEYINEWLKWHIEIGFEHFFICDNDSKIPIRQSVKDDYIPFCTFIDYPTINGNTQLACYNDILNKYGKTTKWLAFIDTDEFIRTTDGRNINDFLKDYEEYDGIYAQWIIYNANGLIKKSDEPQRVRFTEIINKYPSLSEGKSIVQPSKIFSMGCHFPSGVLKNRNIVDSNFRRMFSPLSEFSKNNKIFVDHYFTRSYEEWLEKVKRGNPESKEPCEKYNEFFLYNPNMDEEECIRIVGR